MSMREHQHNAMAVAQLLASFPHITKVVYPGLSSHPNYDMAKTLFKNFSGMITFCIKENGKFFKALKVCQL